MRDTQKESIDLWFTIARGTPSTTDDVPWRVAGRVLSMTTLTRNARSPKTDSSSAESDIGYLFNVDKRGNMQRTLLMALTKRSKISMQRTWLNVIRSGYTWRYFASSH